jgi:enoyl-CoA hydratase/carnithine racemase
MITTERRGAILAIGIDRAERRNALTGQMYDDMTAAFQQAERDESIRVVLVHGRPEAFCAGNDLEDFMKHPPESPDSPVFRFITTASRCPRPVVAAVRGVAVGIGTTMLLHCELVYAADDARFHLPFASLGLVPENASSYLLPMIAGYQRAAELLLLAEPFGAQQAHEAGFVTRVLPADDVLPAAWKAAERLASLPASSIAISKVLMKKGHAEAIAVQMAEESGHFRRMLKEPAAREALEAFFQKRKPDFTKNSS